jgi:thiol peroxidase
MYNEVFQKKELDRMQTTNERSGVATVKGKPLTLIGAVPRIGDVAPPFTCAKSLFETATLNDFSGKIKLISVIPSIDTGVCDAQTRKWNESVAALGPSVCIITVSADLPMAQARWCGAAGISSITMLSDYKDGSFGAAYGVRIKELHLLMRSVFVIDKNDRITYTEVLSEMTEHPNYEQALNAVRALL